MTLFWPYSGSILALWNDSQHDSSWQAELDAVLEYLAKLKVGLPRDPTSCLWPPKCLSCMVLPCLGSNLAKKRKTLETNLIFFLYFLIFFQFSNKSFFILKNTFVFRKVLTNDRTINHFENRSIKNKNNII